MPAIQSPSVTAIQPGSVAHKMAQSLEKVETPRQLLQWYRELLQLWPTRVPMKQSEDRIQAVKNSKAINSDTDVFFGKMAAASDLRSFAKDEGSAEVVDPQSTIPQRLATLPSAAIKTTAETVTEIARQSFPSLIPIALMVGCAILLAQGVKNESKKFV